MDRRTFVKYVLTAAATHPLWSSAPVLAWGDEDEAICRRKFSLAVSLSLQNRPIREVIIQMGISFLGTEYVPFALEVPGPERLVVNMRGLDCVSFYENALVLARCIKKGTTTFQDYREELKYIRYRGGVIDGYPSRLHYTSDYFYDNEKKGIWTTIARQLGGRPFRKVINYMSTHPDQYRQLRENPRNLEAIRKIEEEISARETYFIPKTMVAEIEPDIESGDVIGITTDIGGLDVSHTAIVVRQSGGLHLLHAPSVGKRVEISEATLVEYLAKNKRHTGIMVVRAKEPLG